MFSTEQKRKKCWIVGLAFATLFIVLALHTIQKVYGDWSVISIGLMLPMAFSYGYWGNVWIKRGF